ncbi:hypothetical protein P647_2821 [Acinetobacter baumannii UH12208]|nr:hypothetical protein [Providencia stuartii]ETQ22977.1 hypothetical protein P647_2821 [Acinetobacter baumannii UH12208]ETQ44105.1 hypothetical protein P656_2195 [Acinetobacter baumannii UH16208]ETQ52803.1 hypothetical protein P658_2597 [Acinetobacter baumannii UH19608]ETQ61491.1 hypothetical protein P662_3105 [Acinetobacter baumannii UH22908]EXD07860.1 putative transposase [Acinetobacter baumannii 1289546]EXD84261.1 putative transposase [Acinetobacter baumannii 993520]EXG88608.1 putative t
MGSCAAPSAKGDDKFITTDYLQQCPNLDYAQYSCAPKRGEHGDGGSVAKIGGSQR